MAAKSLQCLGMKYNTKNFFHFVCKTFKDGDKEKAVSLFKEMRPDDKKDFMNELNYCTFTEQFGDGPWQMDLLHEIIYSLKM